MSHQIPAKSDTQPIRKPNIPKDAAVLVVEDNVSNLPGGGLIGGNDELVFFFATHGAYTRGFGDYWSGPDAAR